MGDDVGNQITPEGLAALEAELEQLEGEGRRAMAERIKEARAFGDLKENSEYHDAKDAQAHLETRIQRLQDRRRNAVVVEGGTSDGTVALGSRVTVRDEESGRENTHTIVSATEADPAAGRLSVESPLARALNGKAAGEVAEFDAPRGVRRLRVVAVD